MENLSQDLFSDCKPYSTFLSKNDPKISCLEKPIKI
jgi:hypothetical protein